MGVSERWESSNLGVPRLILEAGAPKSRILDGRHVNKDSHALVCAMLYLLWTTATIPSPLDVFNVLQKRGWGGRAAST